MATPSKYFSNNNMSGNGKGNGTDTKQGAGSQPVKAITDNGLVQPSIRTTLRKKILEGPFSVCCSF